VAEDIVDLLEAIEIDPEDRHAAVRVFECVIQSLAEHDSIGQAGQWVVQGSIGKLRLEALLLSEEPLQLGIHGLQIGVGALKLSVSAHQLVVALFHATLEFPDQQSQDGLFTTLRIRALAGCRLN
jgi:hypothetical protein